METAKPVAVRVNEVPVRARPSVYPPNLHARIQGREKRALGDFFGLKNFGVNLTRLPPGSASSFRHAHALQDEFIYVVQGTPVLHTDAGRLVLTPGMCAGFPAGTGDAHTLLNEGTEDVIYLEVGDRTDGDSVTYPDDDLAAQCVGGVWVFSHKDGTPF
ncbi:cupin domain-containing protein [Limnobacter humi]|uniref:Cupin domain-containing protein n=1 Tax=Limnobacter humi TaxID=1778671 RepID=A0ABT1WG47_9BURK|nr:cupin domain-containing protein [Limnobacter humi]MCQ8896487.1 cupin domain-containing protein [Limnobacter humi]